MREQGPEEATLLAEKAKPGSAVGGNFQIGGPLVPRFDVELAIVNPNRRRPLLRAD
jgi:hypothetical protein